LRLIWSVDQSCRRWQASTTFYAFALALITSVVSVVPATADIGASDAPSSGHICGAVTYQLKHLPKTLSPLDLPREIKLDGLVWPHWVPIDPTLHFDVLQKATYWSWARENNLGEPLNDFYKAHGTPSEHQSDWIRRGKPFFQKIIRDHTLKMEFATVSFFLGPSVPANEVTAAIIRFRIEPDPVTISKVVNGRDAFFPTEYNWEYVAKSMSDTAIVNNTPISLGGLMSRGELAVIKGQLALFETDSFGQPYRREVPVEFIYVIDPHKNSDEYGIFNPSSICGT
jgi:hypothetical protein